MTDAGAARRTPGRGRIYASITDTVGDTPLVSIDRIGKEKGVVARLLAKLEFFNPISSVKDRIGVSMIDALEAQIRPRSGLALKDGVTVLNSPGTIDADYRGEIGVILINFGDKPFVVRRGARIAQLVVCSVERVALISSARLTSSVRGSNGFGSTGRSS